MTQARSRMIATPDDAPGLSLPSAQILGTTFPRPEHVPMSASFPRRVSRRLVGVGLGLAVMASAGCQGGTGIVRRWSMQKDETLAKPITAQELGDSRNMVSRWLSPGKSPHTGGTANVSLATTGSKPDPQTEAEIGAAETLFQQGKLAEAEAAFVALERKATKASVPIDARLVEADKDKSLWGRVKGGQVFSTPKRSQPLWGERVLFYLAECRYQQGKLVSANDTYEKLLNSYPGSPHLEKAVAREYDIAQTWFAAGEDAARAEAREAAQPGDKVRVADKGEDKDKDDSVRQASWLDHFNGRMPLIDVDGYALKAMEHVRQHDPTGPLADVAALRIADHYFAKGDYENAAVYYDQMIADHPKSKLLQRAQLGSIDAKMKGYLGPEYDAEGLEQARATIRQTMTSFPEREAPTTEKLYHSLDLIADQQAEITYKNGEFYKRTGYTGGAEFYFAEVRARWPKSPWAAKAKDQLATLAKMPRKSAAPSKILTLPGASDPNAMGNSMGSMATMPGSGGGGMGMPAGAAP